MRVLDRGRALLDLQADNGSGRGRGIVSRNEPRRESDLGDLLRAFQDAAADAERRAGTLRKERESEERITRLAPSSEWKTPLTALELRDARELSRQFAPYQTSGEVAAMTAGWKLAHQHGRDPWKAADAAGVPIAFDAHYHRGTSHVSAFVERGSRAIHLGLGISRPEAWEAVAHELGHLQLGHLDAIKGRPRDQIEREACAFAAGFFAFDFALAGVS